jgi:hypothetical protein
MLPEVIFTWLSSRNWPLTFQVIRDIAAALAAFAGFTAIWRWQSELIGRDQYEMAKRISSAAYQLTTLFESRASSRKQDLSLATPDLVETLERRIKEKGWFGRDTYFERISELKDLQWQSSVLGMPTFSSEIAGFEEADQAFFMGTLQLYMLATKGSREPSKMKSESEAIEASLTESVTKSGAYRDRCCSFNAPSFNDGLLFRSGKLGLPRKDNYDKHCCSLTTGARA